MSTVFFAHGRESGPWGAKIRALAGVAEGKGWRAQCPDFRGVPDPDRRVAMLLGRLRPVEGRVVLAGSSMGGYVATVASATVRPLGLFLMAPAFYLSGYRDQDPAPATARTVVVHGWNDALVPAAHAIRFAQQHRAQLHLVDDGHRLQESLPFLKTAFARFLDGLDAGGT